MNKVCSLGNLQCPYCVLSSSYRNECTYVFYCDFQLPRDSRNITWVYNPLQEGYTPKPNNTEGNVIPPQGGTGEIKTGD